MDMLRLPVVVYSMLLVVGFLLHADIAISADSATSDCSNPCRVQHKYCFDKVKDSPNDIERELCDNERKECYAKCEVETRVLQEELKMKALQENQEKALLGLPVKRSAQEREEDNNKAEQEKQESETLNGNIKILRFDNFL